MSKVHLATLANRGSSICINSSISNTLIAKRSLFQKQSHFVKREAKNLLRSCNFTQIANVITLAYLPSIEAKGKRNQYAHTQVLLLFIS